MGKRVYLICELLGDFSPLHGFLGMFSGFLGLLFGFLGFRFGFHGLLLAACLTESKAMVRGCVKLSSLFLGQPAKQAHRAVPYGSYE